MNKSKWMTGIAILTLGASLAVAAPIDGSGNWGKHEGRGGRHHRGAGFEKLNLTDAQKEQVRAIRKESRQQNEAFFTTARDTMKELRAARKANDTARVEALKPTLQSQRAQMKQIRQADEQRIAAILTTEQRTQWEQLKAERAARRADHEANHGDRR